MRRPALTSAVLVVSISLVLGVPHLAGPQSSPPLSINYDSGRVGIGTASPTSPLTVAGTIESTSGGVKFPDGTTQTSAARSQAHGQARLIVASATEIRLVPFNGNGVVVNGISRIVPGGGVSLSSSGLAAAAHYYVYASVNGETMTLETSTTAHVTDPSTGIQVKSGDASRTVVGMILTNGSAQFSEALTLSYFNRKPKVLSNSCAWGATPSAYPTWAELSNANRHTFIAWADDVVSTNLIGHIHGSGGTDSAAIGVAFDGISPAMHIHANPTNSLIIPLTIVLTKTGLAENASHYATVSGWQHSGTSVSFGGTASGCGLFEVMVRG